MLSVWGRLVRLLAGASWPLLLTAPLLRESEPRPSATAAAVLSSALLLARVARVPVRGSLRASCLTSTMLLVGC